MALISIPSTFTVGAIIVASQHNDNFRTIYNDYNGNITDANISGSANIADSKLAQLVTAAKVSGAALTLLTSIPSGAGVIPFANTLTNFKLGTTTRDETVASGSQAITGVGFIPRLIYIFGANPTSQRWSQGIGDGTNNYCIHTFDGTQYMDVDATKILRTNKNTNLNT